MKLYNLVPTDSKLDDWLFWYEDADAYRRPKPIYSDLVCAKCGKLDEVAAISRGMDPNVTIRSKRDYIGTTDGFEVITRRAREAFGEEGVKGLRFIQLSDGDHSVLWPEVRVPTDLSMAGFQFGPKCVKCGRYREGCVGPMKQSLTTPESHGRLCVRDLERRLDRAGLVAVRAGAGGEGAQAEAVNRAGDR